MDFYARGIQGFEQGRARAVRNRLGELSSAALAAPIEQRGQFASQIGALDPEAGFAMEQDAMRATQAAQAESERKLRGMAGLLASVPQQARGSLYARVRPGLQQMGFDAPEAWSDDLMPVMQQLAGQNQAASADSPRMAALRRAHAEGLVSDEQLKQATLIEYDLAPGATAGALGWVEEYDPNTGAMVRKPVMNRGLTYTGGPLIGEASAPQAPQSSLRVTPTGEAPMPDDPEVLRQIAEGMASGREFSVAVPPSGAPVMTRPATRPSQPQSMNDAARRTLDAQTFGGMPGTVQSSPTTAQRAANEAEVARASTEARIEAEREATGGFAQEATLRGEFEKATAGSRDVISAYERVASAARSPTAAGDLSLIFGYMKMLDPGSVVREGEFANAQNAAGVPDRIVNTYNNLMRGERLNPAQRADFLRQAASLRDQAQSSIDRNRERFRGLAGGYGLNPDRVAAPGAAPPGDAAGDSYEVGDVIEAGGKRYRVVGGDPLDPDLEEIL